MDNVGRTWKQFAKRVVPRSLLRVIKSVTDPSQRDGEIALRRLVRDFECQPFIIDVGANDGVTVSNSFEFVKLGWRAILIEPAPAVFKKLVANCGYSDRVTCLQIACSDTPGEADLYFGSDGEDGFMSTLCTSNNEWFSYARSTQSVKVQIETITNVLRQYDAPNRPGILLIDCEGMDYEALLGLDFAQYRPTVIVTEEYEAEPEKQAAKFTLLFRSNYSLVQKFGSNTFWIDRSAKRRQK